MKSRRLSLVSCHVSRVSCPSSFVKIWEQLKLTLGSSLEEHLNYNIHRFSWHLPKTSRDFNMNVQSLLLFTSKKVIPQLLMLQSHRDRGARWRTGVVGIWQRSSWVWDALGKLGWDFGWLGGIVGCLICQGSLNETHIWGDRTMRMYGDFEGFPLR